MTVVNTGDVVLLAQVFNSASPTPPCAARRDLSQHASINTGDLVIPTQFLNRVCG